MRYLLFILIFSLFLLPAAAQEEEQTPYEIALQRIEKFQANGETSLLLSGLGLTEMPLEIAELSNLKLLDLSDNPLTSLSPEIGNLTNLEELWIQGTELTTLPPEFGNLHNLQRLYLNGNQLLSLPPEFGQLQALRELYLDDNQLSTLPVEFGNLKHLCRLFLPRNQFQYLPAILLEIDWESGDEILGSCYFSFEGNPLISPPQEVIAQGTPAIMEYLRNEAWWHMQRLIAGGAGFVGIVAAIVLGLRWRNRRNTKKKRA
jgi:internalin A